MSEWEGKTRGGVSGYRIFIFMLRHFDLRVAYAVLRVVALYFVFFSPRAFAAQYRFRRSALGAGRMRAALNVYQNYYVLGQTLLDKIVMFSGIPNRLRFDNEDERHIEDMILAGRGGMLLGAHIGNWEIAGHLLNRLDSTFHIVLLDAEHRRITQLLENAGAQRSLPVITVKDDLSHVFDIHAAFENREFICIHGDRFLPGNRTVVSTFFGRPMHFPYGVFYLAVRYQVPVIFVHAVKTGTLGYQLIASPPLQPEADSAHSDRESQIQMLADAYARNLETIVRRHPAQWFNYHDVYKAA